MTETPGKEPTLQLQGWLETWKTCTQNVLSQVSTQTIVFEIVSELLPTIDSDLWYTVVAGGAVRGEMSLRFPSASATRLAQMFLGETEPDQEITAEHKEALEELLRQIAGLAATALAPAAGGEVQLHVAAASAPSWSSASTACLRAPGEAGDPVTFEIQISAALSSALQPRVEQTQAAKRAPAPAPPSSAGYGRLLDVGLDVKLRFGTRRMLLRDVLALSAGLVVELDSQLHQPVDLLLEGSVIAHGEVVIVDGKYGLRVTDIPYRAPPA
jgi:flagellar motor switch protein FliN/FliY